MSGQASQRVRRIASPSTKQGPLKATQTFGLVHGSPTRPANGRKISPSASPTLLWTGETHRQKARRSPDNRASPERNSPSSPGFKVERPKAVRLSPVSVIKRTGSLDTITGPYLTGQWPRGDALHIYSPPSGPVSPNRDQATQTPDEWESESPFGDKRKKGAHKRSASVGNGDPLNKDVSELKIIKARLAKTKEGSRSTGSGTQRLSPVQGNHVLSPQTVSTSRIQSKAVAIPVPHIPKSAVKIRSSVEGLNQEIERALKRISGIDGEDIMSNRTQEPTPDGHRAPITELICGRGTCTVDTQTPSGFLEELKLVEEPCDRTSPACAMGLVHSGTPSSHASSRSQSESPSFPIIPGHMDSSRPSSTTEPTDIIKECHTEKDIKLLTVEHSGHEDAESPDPKYVPSPKPNKSFSFVREPPDGCEKVKTVDESKRQLPTLREALPYCPIKKPIHASLYHIPSSDSAFCPLYRPYMSQVSKSPTPLHTPSPSTLGAQAQ